jgi:tetratricopeptide (TPR) repeat protein
LHLSTSSLYAYLDNTTLPSPIVLDKILHELNASPGDLRRIADLREAIDARRRQRKRGANRARTPDESPDIVSPWQLPPDVRAFTGRTAELVRLDALLTARDHFSAPTVALLSGTAGVGKTALAVRWAHRRRAEFPHGLLYVDLRGFDPEQPREPGQVLGYFLRALGVARGDIPADLAERTTLFRGLLGRRRMLVLLDNAASDEQVRPLLPNSPQSFVIVTSRNSLNGLVARHGAHHVRVPHLTLADGVSLLQVLIGHDRVRHDQAGAAELVERCALLPLAIRIGAELATTRRRSGLTQLADELHRYHLDLFSAGGDERTAIRTVFSWSYLHLREDRARAFRLLGLHPGQDLDLYTGAALMDIDLLGARLRIDDLVRANLIDEAGDGRYRMHDLLRAYAREEADRCDPAEVEQAMDRLFDHYLRTSASAAALVAPHDMVSRSAIGPPTSALPLENAEDAIDWLDAERGNLLTMAEVAATSAWPLLANQVSALLYRYLATRAHYSDAMTLHTLALKIARNHGSRDLEGWELLRLGVVHLRLGQFADARDHLTIALTIAETSPDPVLEYRTLRHLAQTYLQMGRNTEAHDMFARALPGACEFDDPYVWGHARSGLGAVHDQLGEYDQALAHHYEAVMVSNRLGDHELHGQVLINLGLHYARMDLAKAEQCHRTAVAIARKAGNPGLEATAQLELGIVMAMFDRWENARAALVSAVTLATGIGDRHVEKRARRALAEHPG